MGKTVTKRDGANLYILEEHEFCCVCHSTDWDQIRWWAFGNPADPMKFAVCDPCKDSGRFKAFLAEQFEEALASAPDKFHKNPNGTWTQIERLDANENK